MSLLRRAGVLLAALSLSGCFPWAVKDQHTLKLDAPPSVPHDGIYAFRVEVTGPDGQPAKQTHYGWMIDWPDVRGIPHTGVSFETQQMPVKGGPGKATLRLYVHDASGRTTQIDRIEFTVE